MISFSFYDFFFVILIEKKDNFSKTNVWLYHINVWRFQIVELRSYR